MKKNIVLIIALILVLVLTGVVIASNVIHKTKKIQNPMVTMEVEGFGTVKMELYPDMAPNTVANFVSLINEGYYNGLTFHRAEEGFMIQGGEKKDEESKKAIKGEFSKNGYEQNTLRHDRGVLSMARQDYTNLGLTTEGYNSAYAQFFIMTDNNTSINGYYAAFGKVTEGMDVVDKISKSMVEAAKAKEEAEAKKAENSDATTTEDTTKEEEKSTDPVITKMTVDTFGVDYGTPERIDAFDYNSYLMKLYGLSF